MEEERIHLIVKGRVQGVFFRATAKETAKKLNIKGWVKNLSDGSVEIIAEGSNENLEKFLTWCKTGPENAKVDNLETKRLPSTGEFKQFDIQY